MGRVPATTLPQSRLPQELLVDELADTRARLQSLIDSVDGIVWEVDVATWCFTFVSEQAERLLGYPLDAWKVPGFWGAILHPADRGWAVDFCLERTQRLERHDFEYRVLASDGRLVWLRDIVTVVVEAGQPVKLRGIMVDITARREAQAECARLLASEKTARVHAEEAVRLRDEFLSIAAHELYTPLTSLQLSVHALGTSGGGGSPAARERNTLRIARQSDRLARLIGALLDVSRLQSGGLRLQLEDVDLVAVVTDVAAQFADDLDRARCDLSLELTAPARGRWDRILVEQIVTNLLGNALKFGAGKPIEVCVATAGDIVRLVVRDHGIGIPPDRLPHIFDRFERAVSARAYGGLGLGLYIVRGIVDALGGAVRVVSAPTDGATFTVELPGLGPASAPG